MTVSMNEQVALHCGGLCYRPGQISLLEDVALQLPQGQVHAVIGENGAGKSTLLNVLAGDLKPTSGWVKYGDCSIDQISVASLARKRAYLRQEHGLNFSFKVIDVIRLGRLPFGPDNQIVKEVVAALTLDNLCERDYISLSGGEKQRVQVARVLAQVWQAEQSICFLDEPLTALDLRHQSQLLKVLQELAQRGLTVLMVLHSPQIAARYADRLILMQNGRIFAHGTADEVFTEANMKQAFGLGLTSIFSAQI